jgi:lysophospholipid hydrolase
MFEEIKEKGYNEALKTLDRWDDEGRLPTSFVVDKGSAVKSKRKGLSARRNSI